MTSPDRPPAGLIASLPEGAFDAVRADGGLVRIRPLTSEDESELEALIDRASDTSIHRRFFSMDRRAAHRWTSAVSAVPSIGRCELVAVVSDHVVGIAGFETMTPLTAEVALLIDDAHHHMGIGTLMLERLVFLARQQGIEQFVADVLGENRPVIELLEDLGLPLRRTSDLGPELEFVCDLRDVSPAFAAVSKREQIAVRASLAPLLSPRCVAVVGATDRERSAGRTVLEGLLAAGFTGPIYAVNPAREEVLGRRAYRSVADLPEAPDLAVIAVPARSVVAAVEDCGAAGTRSLVIVSSGFREVGAPGAALEAEIVDIARRHGMRLVGPNCLGIVNTNPAIRLRASIAPLDYRAGGLGLASQSGALGIAVAADARRQGVGISQFVSMGNKADVSGNDLLLWWAQDPQTTVVGLYLESFGNPRKFLRISREVSRHKPVLALKSGRTAAGKRGGASHTAAAATPDQLVDALCAQAGVLRVETMADLLDTVRVLDARPLPAGPRLAVVGNSGGPEILAADAAGAAGLELPELSPATAASIRNLVPTAAGCANPVDLGSGMSAADLAQVLKLLVASGEIDAIAVVTAVTSAVSGQEVVAAVSETAEVTPLVVSVLGGSPTADVARAAPVFDYPERGVAALGRAWGYAHLQERRTGVVPVMTGVDDSTATAILASSPGQRWADIGAALLTAYGISVPAQEIVTSAQDATAAAERIGFPVTLKASGLIHKTDVGGVRLALQSAADVAEAATELSDLAESVLVQRQVAAGVELIVGGLRHPDMGPLVMVGVGGVLADVLPAKVFRLAPLTDVDADEMVAAVTPQRLLAGFRGMPPVDRRALRDLLLRVSALMVAHPRVAELDVNPVIANCAGLQAVDVKVRLAAEGRPEDELWRALRRPAVIN